VLCYFTTFGQSFFSPSLSFLSSYLYVLLSFAVSENFKGTAHFEYIAIDGTIMLLGLNEIRWDYRTGLIFLVIGTSGGSLRTR
jgi:hypothetical protein